MRKIAALVACILLSAICYSQDFSNKGKDFWISYAAHIDATASAMGIYITSNVATSGTITVGTNTFPYTVAANSVYRFFIGPNAGSNTGNGQVYLSGQDDIQNGAAIHVTAERPVAVYAHIINRSRSGASLVLPVNVWGKEYIAPSYRNTGGSPGYGEINVMASEANTVVEITPTVTSRNGRRAAGVPYTITLDKPGDVYQVQFTLNADISGTKVRSIATNGTGCKKIGVFSATTWSGFDCTNASGGDNLYQQLFPVAAWGKNFLTAPYYSRTSDIVRVFVSDVNTIVNKTEGGITTSLSGLVNNSYYEYNTNQPTSISADKPISVVHYITSQTCGRGNSAPADPEMIVLNPIEQTINDITVFSAHRNWVPSNQSVVSSCFLNIIIQTSAAASFKINGAPPISSFIQIPGTNFSYLQEDVTGISLSNPVQTLKADSAFSAIAYGFGDVESYGYNAGTNVKDLFQHVIIRNEYATVDFPATCVNTPFNFGITLPYVPQSLAWDFHGAFANTTNNSPVPDSSYIIDNKTVYVFRLPNTYSFTQIGTYPVSVIAINPTSDGCGGTNQIDYDLEVLGKPNAAFYFNHSGCLSDSVRFMDTTNTFGRPVVKWRWNFGDNTVDTLHKNPVKLYTNGGTYPVKMAVITDVGCLADTTISITVTPPPVAKFESSIQRCPGTPIIFTDRSTILSGSIAKWYWDYGNGRRDTLTTNAPRSISYTNAGTYIAKLFVESLGGCRSLVDSQVITINVAPVANFNTPVICLPSGNGQFTNKTTIADGTQSEITYLWNFGDGATSTATTPVHIYSSTGPFNVVLTATSKFGCADDTTIALTSVYTQPKAVFGAPSDICLSDTARFSDTSTAINSSVVKWFWQFGDGTTDTIKNPVHTYQNAGAYIVKLYVQSAIGCFSDTVLKTVNVNALPVANYTISNPSCLGQAINFTSTSISASGTVANYEWKLSDTSTVMSTTLGTITKTYGAIGTYNTSLIVTSDKGCKSSVVSKPVTIHVLPVANFILPNVCLSDPFADFTDSSYISDGSSLQYSWNFGDPAASPTNPNTSTLKNSRHSYTNTGVYNVSLTVTSASGCSNTISKQVTINGSTPVADFVVQNAGNICAFDTVSIQDKSTVDYGRITKVEIYWDNGNNPSRVETDNAPAFNKAYNHLYTNNTQSSTQYAVRLVAYSGGVCVSTITKNITIYSNPIAAVSSNPSQVCQGNPVTFTDTAINTNLSVNAWRWTFANNQTANTRSASNTFNRFGTIAIRLQNVSTDGCASAIVTSQFNVNPIPVVNAGNDINVLEGGQATILASASGSADYRYEWSPATWLNSISALQPVTIPQADITYKLTVTGRGNCVASDEVNIILLKQLVPPNAFSPNGDGINDKWIIQHLESYPGSTVRIYDRYGRAVYSPPVGTSVSWDGNLNGVALPVGTYYYIIDPKNGRQVIKGSVTILR